MSKNRGAPYRERQPGQTDETGVPLVLRDYIFHSGMGQQEFAYKVGVTVSAVSKWEKHQTVPHLDNLAMIQIVLLIPDGRILFPRVFPELIPEEYVRA